MSEGTVDKKEGVEELNVDDIEIQRRTEMIFFSFISTCAMDEEKTSDKRLTKK